MTTQTIPDGFYRAFIGNTSYTFRVCTRPADYKGSSAKRFVAGRQEVSLCGKDSRVWRAFGIVHEGKVSQFITWKNNEVNEGIMAAVNLLFHDPEHAAKEYAHAFGRCYVCNRKLTDPHSLASGIGPECAGTRKHVVELGDW